MSKAEENDLQLLVNSLASSEYKSFKKKLQTSSKKSDRIKLDLLHVFWEKKTAIEKFQKKYSLDVKKYNFLKHKLFQGIINFLKSHYNIYSELALQHKLIEFDILLKRGLFIKANRKLKNIKEIAAEKCDFNTCTMVQSKAIEYRLFEHTKNKITLQDAAIELKEYQELLENLNAYRLLSDEVLFLHYGFLDTRVENRGIILKHLDNDLLKDKSKARSVLSVYYYYRIKSLVYMGDNNYEACKEYSLKAFNYLSANPSEHRNDYLHQLRAINNYLDSSLNNLEVKPFEEMFPKMQALAETNFGKVDVLTDSITYQLMYSLKLNYLWLKKDYEAFLIEKNSIENNYILFENSLRPNLKLEILLGMARMHFIAGNYKEANKFCVEIAEEKTNPTSLFMSCGNLLRIMVNFELENYRFIPHLIRTSKYFLKNRGRLFKLEELFLKGIYKMKPYASDLERLDILKELQHDIKVQLQHTSDNIIDKKIRILDWITAKIEMLEMEVV
ncbi:hypothetical protein [Kordia sp.]|uniref:hypothetical protein n=1 Tax=Kordia sp. TaxID=1965332 RepID=UPI003B5C265A